MHQIRFVIYITFHFIGHNRCLVGRGDEHLGFIDLKTTLDVKAESMNIHNQDKRPMAFFQSSAPSDQDIRAMYPSYNNPLGMYSLELLCRDICNEPDDVMADSGYVLVRACLNVEELVMPTSSITYLPSDSSKLKVIWKSQKNYQKPYSINALEIKFNHTELTGELFFEKVLARDTQRKLKIIVDVWVGGTEGDSAPPIRISYCAYSVYKLLEAAGYPKKGFYSTDSSLSVWSKPLPRSLIRVARLRPHKESESDEENSGPGFLTKLFQKKQIDDGVTDVTDENEKSEIDDQKHGGVFAAFKKTKKEKLSDSVDATSVRASHSSSSNGIIQRTRTISNQGQDTNQPSEEEKMQAGGGPGPRSRTDSGLIPSAANENDFEHNENNGNERNERKNSILSTIEKEKEKATRLEEEKLLALEMLTSTSTKPLIPYVKKVKLKPLKLNPDFVREMAAATSYRDPFYERLQLAKLTKKVCRCMLWYDYFFIKFLVSVLFCYGF